MKIKPFLLPLLAFLMTTTTGRAGTPDHPNALLITKFYEAFAEKDAATMASCYATDVHFSDEVFPELRGAKAGAMWRMLCERGADLRIEFSGIEADDREGKAHWEAWYTFSKTGRLVHNVIDARFEFRDGRMVRHADSFDFRRWAKQALGVWGTLLGWTSFLRNKIRQQAAKALDQFIRENP